MRILLDASSLIDAEHGKPLSFEGLDKVLREHQAQLVLTYTSVLEFAAPFERTKDRYTLRAQLQQVERMPVRYLNEGGIKLAELREAVKAFIEGRDCVPIDPYRRRWDETLVPVGRSPMEILVNPSLYDLVSAAVSRGNIYCQARKLWEQRLKRGFEQVRSLTPEARKATGWRFMTELSGELAHHGIPFPSHKIGEFANWVYGNPARCPGFRLAYEWHQEWMKNVTQPFAWNNIPDRAHVLAIPYVDAITMDGNAADLCRRACRQIRRRNSAISYEERIFTGLKDLLDAKFSSYSLRCKVPNLGKP